MEPQVGDRGCMDLERLVVFLVFFFVFFVSVGDGEGGSFGGGFDAELGGFHSSFRCFGGHFYWYGGDAGGEKNGGSGEEKDAEGVSHVGGGFSWDLIRAMRFEGYLKVRGGGGWFVGRSVWERS